MLTLLLGAFDIYTFGRLLGALLGPVRGSHPRLRIRPPPGPSRPAARLVRPRSRRHRRDGPVALLSAGGMGTRRARPWRLHQRGRPYRADRVAEDDRPGCGRAAARVVGTGDPAAPRWAIASASWDSASRIPRPGRSSASSPTCSPPRWPSATASMDSRASAGRRACGGSSARWRCISRASMFFGRAAAAAGAGLLSLHVAQVWFARSPYAELPMQALLFAALYAYARLEKGGSALLRDGRRQPARRDALPPRRRDDRIRDRGGGTAVRCGGRPEGPLVLHRADGVLGGRRVDVPRRLRATVPSDADRVRREPDAAALVVHRGGRHVGRGAPALASPAPHLAAGVASARHRARGGSGRRLRILPAPPRRAACRARRVRPAFVHRELLRPVPPGGGAARLRAGRAPRVLDAHVDGAARLGLLRVLLLQDPDRARAFLDGAPVPARHPARDAALRRRGLLHALANLRRRDWSPARRPDGLRS